MARANFVTRWFNHPNVKWLYIGLGIKRWLVVLVLGITLLGLGLAYLLINLYRATRMPDAFHYVTLQFLPREARGVVLGLLGIGLIAVALVKLNQSLLSPFITNETDLVETLYRKRARRRGPKIVALGGGTGLSTLLRGLKEHTEQLTAIVTVADDGGSSGRLRRDLGVLPPGDFRQCIAALADSEPLMTQLFQYRFGEGAGLDGHSFGNLFIAAMAGVTGNFERALIESSRVLAVRGRIMPSTLHNVTLCADFSEPTPSGNLHVEGESEISHQGAHIERVYLNPEHVPAYPDAVRAILDADLIIAGPGSLYTSVIPNLLVADIRHAVQASKAAKVYVCNVATQPGETDAFSVQDHCAALAQHAGEGVFLHAIANNNWAVNFPTHNASQLVRVREQAAPTMRLTLADLADEAKPWRHDPRKLAHVILQWYDANTKSTRAI